MRIVSLVPSVTETLAVLGLADRVVGVTRYCVHGAPDSARRVGGTKNPDLAAIIDLAPDLVVTNTEENRPPDIAALREAGLAVLETFPRTVAEVTPMLVELAAACGADNGPVDELVAEIDAALADAGDRRPATGVPALTLIWRKPWMAVGAGTYVDDLLATCGLRNVVGDLEERYPRVDAGTLAGRRPAVVILPSEPYAFGDKDVPALRELLGDAQLDFVDGELLTWHGHRTSEALRHFSALAAGYAS